MTRFQHQLRLIILALTLASATACSTPKDEPLGQLALPLETEQEGSRYQLQGAVFEIAGDGPTVVVDSDPDSGRVSLPLAAGGYTVQLLDGWELAQSVGEDWVVVPSRLTGDNPATVVIQAGTTSELVFNFEVDGEALALLEGGLNIGISVGPVSPSALVISEIMKNPQALPDSEGEWIELTNVGFDALALDGCVLQRGSTALALDGLVVAPLAVVVLASSASPGFEPDQVFGNLTLPNSSTLELSVVCEGSVVDAVALDPELLGNAPGHAWSLSGDRLDAVANDAPDAWCDAAESYSDDYGSPGALNPPCSKTP